MLSPCCMTRTSIRDSETWQSSSVVRRRRQCRKCGHRFTTYERASDTVDPSTLVRGDTTECKGSER